MAFTLVRIRSLVATSDLGVTFTADSTGSTDVSAALGTQAAAATTAGQPLIVPPGDYRLDGGTSLPDGLTLWAPSGARFFGSRPSANLISAPSKSTFRGLTLENTGQGDAVTVNIQTNAASVLIEDCTIIGNQYCIAVHANSSGITDLTIRDCRIGPASYGILTNSNANDIVGVTIDNCVFATIYADAIEFNHPAVGLPACHGFRVTNNMISVPPGLDTEDFSGFGIGVAGVADVTITGNTILTARKEGIHVEDAARNVTITGNTVRAISGVNAYGGIVVYPVDTEGVEINGNIVEDITGGDGIIIVYDTTALRDIQVQNNIIRNVSGNGIFVASDSGSRFVIQNNLIRSVTNGVYFDGGVGEIVVHDNLISDCSEYGVACGAQGTLGRIRSFRGNVITECASGDYQGVAISAGTATVLDTRYLTPTGTSPAAVGGVVSLPLFRLGRYATGTVTIQFRVVNNWTRIVDSTWAVTWDGTIPKLTARKIGEDTSTGDQVASLSMVGGVLTAAVVIGAGSTVDCTAQFSGVCLESSQTFSGTVAAASAVTLTDAATIATDASLGDHFKVTLAGNRTLAAPSAPTDGQVGVWEVTASGGARTLTLTTGSAGAFTFGTTITALSATSSGLTDFITARYSLAADRWRVIDYVKGY